MPIDLAAAPPIGLDTSYRWPHAARLLPDAETVVALLGPEPSVDNAAAGRPVEQPRPRPGRRHARRAQLRPPPGGRSAPARAMIRAVSVALLAAAAWLAAWSVVPRMLGWQPVLVIGGSMAPRIERGDVVLVRPAPAAALTPGAVITFIDAGRRGELVTHRVVAVLPDGRLRTRGDHNRDDDPQPVPIAAVRGRAVLRLPAIGRPAIWVRDGRWAQLGLLVAVAAVLLLGAGTRRERPSPISDDNGDVVEIGSGAGGEVSPVVPSTAARCCR